MRSLGAQVKQLRVAVLNKLIDNKLIEQAARNKGMSVADYLALKVESAGGRSSVRSLRNARATYSTVFHSLDTAIPSGIGA